jgi:hypothetical protein
MPPKFYNANGSLTKYAFACGYMEKRGDITLFRQHTVMHVAGFTKTGLRVWESFDNLTPARRFFRKVSK